MTNLDGPEVERSISTLYDRYSRTVFGVGFKILGDRSLAEELVQEVFLKVWRSAQTFDPSRGSFSTWLYRVTRSVALDLYRKRAHRVRQVSDGTLHIAAARDSSDGPQEVVDESWLSWRVSRALDMLDAPHREVIDLAYFGGLSQREISERTGVPLGTVKTRTASAYKRLRKELVVQDTPREALGRATRKAAPTWGLPTEKTKSKERNLSYNPPFSEATRNESAEATQIESENGKEVMGPG